MKLESKAIQTALKYISSLISPKTIYLQMENKQLSLSASDSGTVLNVIVPCVVEKEKDFVVEMSAAALEKAVAGRSDLTLALTNANSVLEVTNKGYKAELVTVALDAGVEFPESQEGQTIRLTPKAWAWLQKAVGVLQLDPVPGVDLNLYCKSSDKGAIACTFDHVQMAFAKAKEGFGKDFTLYLPYDKLAKVFKGLPYDGTTLTVGQSGLIVKSKSLRAFLPLAANEDQISLDAVDERLKDIPKQKGKTVELSKEELSRLLENVGSLDAPNLRIAFSQGKKGVIAKCTSPNGTITTSIKGEVAAPFAIDKSFLTTLVRVSKEDSVSFTVVDNAYLVAKTGSLYYVAGLQEE